MLAGSVNTSVLTLIQDGMDQAKFRMPRLDPQLRHSKLSERLYRPQMHILASWIHGHSLHFWVSNEDVPKNSETSCEAMARALSDCLHDIGQLPLALHAQHDSTYREAKNQFFTRCLLLMTALGCFRSTCVSFLRTGHSRLSSNGNIVALGVVSVQDKFQMISVIIFLFFQNPIRSRGYRSGVLTSRGLAVNQVLQLARRLAGDPQHDLPSG